MNILITNRQTGRRTLRTDITNIRHDREIRNLIVLVVGTGADAKVVGLINPDRDVLDILPESVS